MQHEDDDRSGTLREQAHAALRRDDVATAERDFAQLLEVQPDDAEALQFLAARHLARGGPGRAVELLGAASQARPADASIWHQLGAAQMHGGDFDAAVGSLQRGLELAPGLFVARLRLGVALEQLGRQPAALVAYFGAINAAQAHGRWMSDETTPPGMRDAVKHAMRYVDVGRRNLFDAVLEPLRERHGKAALERVEKCLAIYLEERPADWPDPRQRPKFLYFPDIPSQPYYDQDRFPRHRELEAATATMRAELETVLGDDDDTLEPFLGQLTSEALATHVRATDGGEAAWDAFFFFRHGRRHDENHRRCPRTSALLESLPLVRVREHAPETLFSVLRPGSHILPHRGVTNTRLVTHLPLVVPPDCAIRVGGQTHAWKEGQCVTFDDTFEHEAWNKSDRTRVILLMDTWNPDLSGVEREAVRELVAAIGDFNRACDMS